MPMLRARELAFIAEKARVSLAICDPRLSEEMERAACARVVGTGELEARAAREPAQFSDVDTAADDVAIIAFTSGTTGAAKGAVHFHRDLLVVCDLFPAHVLRPTPDDVFCGSPPIAFTFGLGALVLFPLRVGASTLLVDKPTPDALLDAVEAERATILWTAPTLFRTLAERVARRDLRSLTKSVSAGETLPLVTFEAWRSATGIKI